MVIVRIFVFDNSVLKVAIIIIIFRISSTEGRRGSGVYPS